VRGAREQRRESLPLAFQRVDVVARRLRVALGLGALLREAGPLELRGGRARPRRGQLGRHLAKPPLEEDHLLHGRAQ